METKGKQHSTYILKNELDCLVLELDGHPAFDNLAVFIMDPKNRNQYWFRQIHISQYPKSELSRVSYSIVYEDEPMPEFNSRPCPEEHLHTAFQNMILNQISIALDDGLEKCVKDKQAQVGIAKYEKEIDVSLDKLIYITVVKYGLLRQEWMASHPEKQ